MYNKFLIRDLVPGDAIVTSGSHFYSKPPIMRVVVATEKLSNGTTKMTWLVLDESRSGTLVVEWLENNINIGHSWTLIGAKSR